MVRVGASVIHVPTPTTDVQADLQLPSSPAGPNGTLIALVGGIAVVAAILLIFLFVRRRRGKTSSLPPPPPPPETRSGVRTGIRLRCPHGVQAPWVESASAPGCDIAALS